MMLSRFSRCAAVSAALLLCAAAVARAQYADEPRRGSFTFLPGPPLFQPLAASSQEPQVGVRKQAGTSRMKLDIGSTIDLLEYRLSGASLRAGVDFFTHALSTNAQGFRLQIDAVDGFFGGHLSLHPDRDGLALRLRILHLSGHFLDGHFDKGTSGWLDGRSPIPFTRDFGELVGAYEFALSDFSAMVYTGFSYATLIRPAEIRRVATIHGIEIHNAEILGQVLGKPANLFLADNFTLTGVPSYAGTNDAQCGVKFGAWGGSGIKLYLSYYTGLDVFTQYYNVRREEWGLGFAFDFW